MFYDIILSEVYTAMRKITELNSNSTFVDLSICRFVDLSICRFVDLSIAQISEKVNVIFQKFVIYSENSRIGVFITPILLFLTI